MVWYIWISQCTISYCTLSGCPEINPHRLAKLKRRGCWVPPGFKDSGYIHVLEHLEIGNGHIYEIKKKHCITAMFKVHWKWKIWLPALSQVSARGNARGFCTFWLSCWMCFRVWKKWCIILMTGWRDDSWLKVGSDQIPLWIVRLGLYNSINCPVDWECGPFTNQYNKIIKGWRWWRRVLKTHMAPFPLWHFGWSWSGTN